MNILGHLGLRMDSDLLPGNEFNERGFFESREILQLNESILRSLGLTWHSLSLAVSEDNWIDDERIEPAKQRLISLVKERTRSGPGIWSFKDPRLCLLLPLYRQIFLRCDVVPIFILCNREPGAIALSLERRNKLPRILSELLWMDHTARVIECAGANLKAVIHYEDWFERPVEQARLLGEAVSLGVMGTELPEALLRQTIARDLDHACGRKEAPALSSTQKVYQAIRHGHYGDAATAVSEVREGLRLGIFPSPALCQLYWTTTETHGFTEVDSYCAYTDHSFERKVVRLQITGKMQHITGLRLDPADDFGIARLYSMRLRDSAGEILWEWNGGVEIQNWQSEQVTFPSQIGGPGVEVTFKGKDPYFILPVGERELCNLAITGGGLEFEFEWLQTKTSCRLCAIAGIERKQTAPTTVTKPDGLHEPTSLCQLFWRTNVGHFCEADSHCERVSLLAGPTLIRLPVPGSVYGIAGLRLDPSDSPGVAHLISMRLLNSRAGVIWRWNGQANTLLEKETAGITLVPHIGAQGVLAYFHDSDPVLNLPIDKSTLETLSGAGGVFEFEFAWLGITGRESRARGV